MISASAKSLVLVALFIMAIANALVSANAQIQDVDGGNTANVALIAKDMTTSQEEEATTNEEQGQIDDEGLLVALRNKLNSKWAIEETDKAACCLAAFALCEKPPASLNIKYNPTQLLKTARSQCAPINTMTLKTKPQICAFYNNMAYCAYTPNTSSDWDIYFAGLAKCCGSSKKYCASKTDGNLYYAKEDCIGFALRTDAQLCEQADSSDCKGY